MVGDPYTGLSRAVEVESILRVAVIRPEIRHRRCDCTIEHSASLRKPPYDGPEEPMHDYWQTVIGRQFAAAIQMLRSAVEACPDDLWDERAYGTPFWHLAYH